MDLRRTAWIAATVVAIFLCGCDSTIPTPPAVRALHTVDRGENEDGFFCAGVGQTAVIHGSPDDPEAAWLNAFAIPPAVVGPRMLTVWPAGYRATFNPTLAILDADNRIRLQDGDFIDGMCVTDGDRFLIVPPDDAYALDCGPISVVDCTIGHLRDAERQARATGGRIALLQFVNPGGGFRVRYEDGSAIEGVARAT